MTTSLDRNRTIPKSIFASVETISQYKDKAVFKVTTDKNPCLGDSGAGLSAYYRKNKKDVLLGIMIASHKRCLETDTKYYTRVYDYIPWMIETSKTY